jgi:hypothetical protein
LTSKKRCLDDVPLSLMQGRLRSINLTQQEAAEHHRNDAMALAGLLDMDQVRARLADEASC